MTATSLSPQRPIAATRLALRTSRGAYAALAASWLLVTVAGLAVPGLLGPYFLQVAVHGATLGLLALSVGWLLRQTGLLSFGHAAFYGLAGYTAALGATRWQLPVALAVVLGIAAAALLAFVVGLVIVRVPGIAFAMLTLAIGQLVYVASTQLRSLTNGFDGLVAAFDGQFLGRAASTFTNPSVAWPLAWPTLMVAVAVLSWGGRSVFGRRLAAIRENEERVQFSGSPTYLPRVLAFTISGAVAGVAGVLSVLSLGFISPNDLYWTTSGLALIVAVIGGVGSVAGPPAGAFAFVALQAALSESSHYQVVIGVALIAVVVAAPGGVSALVERASGVVTRRLRRGSDA